MRTERLRSTREERRLSQQDLADQIGVNVKQIGRYELGENEPTADVLTRIAQALEVSTDYLLGLTDNPQGQFSEAELTPIERKVLAAFRRGDLRELMRVVSAEEERPNQ